MTEILTIGEILVKIIATERGDGPMEGASTRAEIAAFLAAGGE